MQSLLAFHKGEKVDMTALLQTNDILGKGAFKTVYKGFDELEGLGESLQIHALLLCVCCVLCCQVYQQPPI